MGVTYISLISIILLFFGHSCVCMLQRRPIRLVDNGYEEITIAISRNIEENLYYIDQLQTIFTQASALLYQTTKQRFNKITIIIPSTWERKPVYGAVYGPQFDLANVVIKQNETGFNRPYVFGNTECGIGNPFAYMHLYPYTVFRFEEIAKTLVHLWGHLRWGLFDEFPQTEILELNQYPAYYVSENGTLLPNTCTAKVKGVFRRKCDDIESECIKSSEEPIDSGCVFCPSASPDVRASIMGYVQSISSIEEFCDSNGTDEATLHNKKANTMQNRICNYRSSWDVMQNHPDFQNVVEGLNTVNTTPVFNIVHQQEEIIVLVIDISASMKPRIGMLRTVCEEYIMYMVQNGSWIGIVLFNNTGHLAQDIVQITSDEDRLGIITKLPVVVSGSTSIGAGLQTALMALDQISKSGYGSTFLLVTDGVENTGISKDSVLPTIKERNIVISSLAFSEFSDINLVPIISNMGGISYFYSENSKSTTLLDFFLETRISNSDSDNPLVQVESVAVSLTNTSKMQTGEFYIDDSTGMDTRMFMTGSNMDNVTAFIKSPSGETFRPKNGRSILIPGLAEVGMYTYNISSIFDTEMKLGVLSHRRNRSIHVINVKSWLSSTELYCNASTGIKLYSSVFVEESPVLNATIKAIVENKKGETFEVELEDKGYGADVIKNDGIYTKYVLPSQLILFGHHNVRIRVSNENLKAVSLEYKQDSKIIVTKPLSDFRRTCQAGGFVYMKSDSCFTSKDRIRPSRISDLKLNEISSQDVRITWTAVGDDLDVGKAKHYDVRVSTNFEELLVSPNSCRRIEQNVLEPRLAGQQETIEVRLDTYSPSVYYIGVRAVDEASNFAEMSNIITYHSSSPTVSPINVSNQHRNHNVYMILGIVMSILVHIYYDIGLPR